MCNVISVIRILIEWAGRPGTAERKVRVMHSDRSAGLRSRSPRRGHAEKSKLRDGEVIYIYNGETSGRSDNPNKCLRLGLTHVVWD